MTNMKMFVLPLALVATPAVAASGPFFSLGNTDFVVLLSFLLFIAVLVYFKVPTMVTGMLDKRADDITSDLAEARKLREEAQSLLASYERKQQEVKEQSERIIAHAKSEAEAAAEKAKEDLKHTIARRIQAAEDQIKSAEAAAIREVRDQAIAVAVGAAGDVIAKKISASDANALIDSAIEEAKAKLH